ncbi:MAG: polyprenyl synthetase family protein [Halioglobus sp.]|nr:polyprenyl synthetase family protein [Halioglobus sp.]
MSNSLEESLSDNRERTSNALQTQLFPPGGVDAALKPLEAACRYSVQNGGKRVRPQLIRGAAAAVDPALAPALLDSACVAIELIHTYSLVHDDLPAMDDDDLRRGQPSLHIAYDEATAILVGDGLQARAFEVLAADELLSAERRVAMLQNLAAAAGPLGMVGGQYIDIQATGATLSLDELRHMHSLKTGRLIRAATALGALAAGADDAQLGALDRFADHIGLAFQVTDDVLDEEADSGQLGKTGGKDKASNKPTYVSLLGLDGAKREAVELLAEALTALEGFGTSADRLRDLARYIVARGN